MRFARTHVIACANQKGGCGKTTSAVSLAAGFALQGYNTCLVDVDPQCNATTGIGIDPDLVTDHGYLTVADIFLQKSPALEIRLATPDRARFEDRLSVVVGTTGLRGVQHELELEARSASSRKGASELEFDEAKIEHRRRLKDSIDSLRGVCDVVVLDTPPDLTFLTIAALIAADWYIIPMTPSKYDVRGLEQLLDNVSKIQSHKHYNPRLQLLGVAVTRYNPQAKNDREFPAALVKSFGEDLVFRNAIAESVRHREAPGHGLSIYEHDRGGKAAEQYSALTVEVLEALHRAEETSPTPEEVEAANA